MEGKKWGYSSNEDISNDDVNLQNASDEDGDLHISLFAQIAVQVNHFFLINN